MQLLKAMTKCPGFCMIWFPPPMLLEDICQSMEYNIMVIDRGLGYHNALSLCIIIVTFKLIGMYGFSVLLVTIRLCTFNKETLKQCLSQSGNMLW